MSAPSMESLIALVTRAVHAQVSMDEMGGSEPFAQAQLDQALALARDYAEAMGFDLDDPVMLFGAVFGAELHQVMMGVFEADYPEGAPLGLVVIAANGLTLRTLVAKLLQVTA